MKQEGGDNSTNIQVKGDYNNGLSYSDARQVALDVFKANYYELSKEAMETVNSRLTLITDNIIKKVYTELTDKAERLKEPSIQSSIYEVQKEYVKTGDDILANRLTTILIERIKVQDRTLEQIVLDEAIKILAKLTNEQIDLLSFHFSLTILSKLENVRNIHSFYNLLDNEILLFCESDAFTNILNAQITHLQSSGCLIVLSEGSKFKPFEEMLRMRYLGLFNKGFSEEEFKQSISQETNLFINILARCQQNNTLLQFNAMDIDTLNNSLEQANIEQPFRTSITELYNQKSMSPNEIKESIISKNIKYKSIFDIWNNSKIKTTSLTPIGVLIAIINYNIKTNKQLNINDWINYYSI